MTKADIRIFQEFQQFLHLWIEKPTEPLRRSNALLQRIDELVRSPTLVPLIDHYLDQLLDAPPVANLCHSVGKPVTRDNASARW